MFGVLRGDYGAHQNAPRLGATTSLRIPRSASPRSCQEWHHAESCQSRAASLRSPRGHRVPRLDRHSSLRITDELDNTNNQVIYGRRGTGKTHALRVLANWSIRPRCAGVSTMESAVAVSSVVRHGQKSVAAPGRVGLQRRNRTTVRTRPRAAAAQAANAAQCQAWQPSSLCARRRPTRDQPWLLAESAWASVQGEPAPVVSVEDQQLREQGPAIIPTAAPAERLSWSLTGTNASRFSRSIDS